jgi:hypothetical protein
MPFQRTPSAFVRSEIVSDDRLAPSCLAVGAAPDTKKFCFFDRFNYQFARKALRILLELNGSAEERQLRRFWRVLGWFVVVDALITVFGVSTAPLLLSMALDAAVGLLVIRSYMEMRAQFSVTLATVAIPGYPEGGE